MPSKTIIALVLAAIGVGYALVELVPWSSTHSHTIDGSEKDRLDRVTAQDKAALGMSRLGSRRSSDATETISIFREVLRAQLDSQEWQIQVQPGDAKQILDLACERLKLVIQPDYDAYMKHLQAVTGLRNGSETLARRLMPRDQWEGYARSYAGCPVDASMGEMRLAYRGGHPVDAVPFAASMQTTQNPVHPFVELGMGWPDLDKPADVIEVRVPISAIDIASGQRVPVFLVIRLARVPPSPTWVPWQVAVTDPTDQAILRAPPL